MNAQPTKLTKEVLDKLPPAATGRWNSLPGCAAS